MSKREAIAAFKGIRLTRRDIGEPWSGGRLVRLPDSYKPALEAGYVLKDIYMQEWLLLQRGGRGAANEVAKTICVGGE